jgi:hypothetical protein
VGLEAAWPVRGDERAVAVPGAEGSATLRSALVRAYLAGRLHPAPRVDVRVGPEALVAIERVTTTGVPGGTTNVRAAGGPGLRAELAVRVAPLVALSVAASADYTPPSWVGPFVIDRSDGGDLFPPSAVRVMVTAGLGVTLAP